MPIRTVEHIVVVLETAYRHGAEQDIPEGARYIKLSETLVNQMVSIINRHEAEQQRRFDELLENV